MTRTKWKPKELDVYYYITWSNNVTWDVWANNLIDNCRLSNDNCFPSEHECLVVLSKGCEKRMVTH